MVNIRLLYPHPAWALMRLLSNIPNRGMAIAIFPPHFQFPPCTLVVISRACKINLLGVARPKCPPPPFSFPDF
ncbi:hypothetical protein BGS_1206 [Beggiatoa sp. SS]|nr:hypothetical protein BGS_1206 [Beggiatoa sp. SS]